MAVGNTEAVPEEVLATSPISANPDAEMLTTNTLDAQAAGIRDQPETAVADQSFDEVPGPLEPTKPVPPNAGQHHLADDLAETDAVEKPPDDPIIDLSFELDLDGLEDVDFDEVFDDNVVLDEADNEDELDKCIVHASPADTGQKRPKTPQSGVPAATGQALVVVDANQHPARRTNDGPFCLTTPHAVEYTQKLGTVENF